MYQFLDAFTVRPEHRDDFARVAEKTARDSLSNEPGYFGAFFTEASAYAEGPTCLMRGNVIGAEELAS